MTRKPRYICQCPKCGCEIERVTLRSATLRTVKRGSTGFTLRKVKGKYEYREVKNFTKKNLTKTQVQVTIPALKAYKKRYPEDSVTSHEIEHLLEELEAE